MQRLLGALTFSLLIASGLPAAVGELPLVDLFYEVYTSKTQSDPPTLPDLIPKVKQRVEPWGGVEQHDGGIRVRVYEAKHADAVERAVAGGGSFELRILANSRDHADIIARAREGTDRFVRGQDGKTIARWIAIDKQLAGDKKEYADWATRIGDLNDLEALVIEDPYRVTGAVLESARASFDRNRKPTVTFKLTAEGGNRIFNLTAENLPDLVAGFRRQLAVIVRGYILSAPSINTAINREGELTGNFTVEETQTIAAAMAAGMPPLPLKLIRRELIQPQAGEKK